MALVVKDRVRVSSTTAGTGALTLGAAITGFQDFSVIGNGNTTYYTIVDPTTGDYEIGLGTFSTTGPTLTRNSVLDSSNAGAAVSFLSNPKDVFVTYPARRSVYMDGTAIVPAEAARLGFANLAQGSALSVLGVTGNATANVASVAAASDHQVLRRSGTALAFGAVALDQTNAVSGTLPVIRGGTGSTTSTGSGAVVLATSPTLSSPVINTPTGIVKGDVGLGNVDNTSDAVKNSATATLTNKTIAFANNTLTNVASIDTAQTLLNKTLNFANLESPVINNGNIDGAAIGATVASSGAFTTLTATSLTATSIGASGGTLNDVTLNDPVIESGTITSTPIGTPTPSTGVFTTMTAAVVDVQSGIINDTTIGASTPSTGAFTNFTASGTAQFTSTGAVTVAKGTTAQRPASPQAGDFRFNTSTSEFEGFNGTAFASVGGAALQNDTATATDVFPLFADATTGTASSLFTSNAKLLYKPSTGEFKSQALVATNGIVVNSATIDEDYTIATGNNAHSVGPLVVNAVVTVSAGSVWQVS